MSKQDPAILGGTKIFPKPIPFNLPALPSLTTLTASFKKILRSGIHTKGSVLYQYETAVKNYIGVNDAVAVSSCTIGLMLVLQALKYRRDATGQDQRKWEVILPSFTFPATAHACLWNNITPVYVDCSPESFLLDPLSVETAISDNTLAILAVHVFGNPVDPKPLLDLANKYSIFLLFDAAHGFGASLNGKPVGGGGIAEVFSTSPTKLLATAEGGIVTTNDEELGQMLRISREYGNPGDYNCIIPGINGRMSELHAVLGLEGLKILYNNASKRRILADTYKEYLSGVSGIDFQVITRNGQSSFKDIAILIKPEFGLSRDILKKALSLEGVPTRTYFDPPLHKQIFSKNITKTAVQLRNTEAVALEVLCLPVQSHMLISQVKRITLAIKKICRHSKAITAHFNNIGDAKVLSKV